MYWEPYNSYYSINDEIRDINLAIEHERHNERRPRSTKHSTTAFYNFKVKKRKKR